jgi:hypothetical protein
MLYCKGIYIYIHTVPIRYILSYRVQNRAQKCMWGETVN